MDLSLPLSNREGSNQASLRRLAKQAVPMVELSLDLPKLDFAPSPNEYCPKNAPTEKRAKARPSPSLLLQCRAVQAAADEGYLE